MFFLRPINWASLLFLGLGYWLYYRYPGAKHMAAESPKSIYEFTVKDIHGNDVPLSNYRGKVLLIVNVASKWYMATSAIAPEFYLNKSIVDYCLPLPTTDQSVYLDCVVGFEILAFPCNQFASQEPGTNEEIHEAVCTRFKAEFPIFDKVEVNGKNTAPLYKFLKSEKGGLFVDAIKWNFTKFLVNKKKEKLWRDMPLPLHHLQLR
ncbi:hypothetical protein DH2020_028919 [Rehmannia glutinosa]|uniref:Glutathione peroxidase n=1 Tax=Rehmannia glutinosa TaxID=99300 RepID=A0ABR0VQ21_REHGL